MYVLRLKKMKKRILVFIISVVLLAHVAKSQENIPSIKLKAVSGKIIDLRDLVANTKDTVLVVSFWATWCMPCIAELDNINDEFEEQQTLKPFKFYGVAIDDARTTQRVKPFVKGKGWKFDVLMDVNSELKRALNITDVPHVIIFKNGKLVSRHTGYITGDENNLFETIKGL